LEISYDPGALVIKQLESFTFSSGYNTISMKRE
jgi:hypothetical protein